MDDEENDLNNAEDPENSKRIKYEDEDPLEWERIIMADVYEFYIK